MTGLEVEEVADGGRAVVSPRGTYLVIADTLRNKLRSGEPTALPSEAELMRQHGVSRTTVRRALNVLAAEGLVRSAPGKGWVPVGAGPAERPLVDRVRDVILTDGLDVGDMLPSEAALSGRLGASRGAVRHALAQLEGTGLVKAVHGKGRIIQAPGPGREGA
ncbi:GntR family transcriptional regulator [Streptomyces sp. NRRL S-1868]|uniref:GntR family transcriptional regulator n=1 Tax=Streptomyces sp. NRRL S-1868 TaxID=1463892 RepID=UPI00099B467E|nr:winged helix-turn-helix domain-containing protein [Streptomyces sp. NRRL S-1868]